MGKSLVCIDNKNINKILNKIENKNILTYGLNRKANYKIKNVRYKLIIQYLIYLTKIQIIKKFQ